MVAIFPRGNKIFTILLVGWTVFNTVACFSWYILMVSHSLSWFELSHGWLAIYSFCRCSWPGHNTISLYCTGIKPETVRTLCSESSACILHALLFICAKIQVKYVHLWVYNMCLPPYELYNPCDSCQETVTVLLKPRDELHMVHRWDGLHLSITCIVYSWNHIQLQWPALPCTPLLSILQPNSQAVVDWVCCYLHASMRQLEHYSTPLSNKSIMFSQFLHCSLSLHPFSTVHLCLGHPLCPHPTLQLWLQLTHSVPMPLKLRSCPSFQIHW